MEGIKISSEKSHINKARLDVGLLILFRGPKTV
jgi:hypothetical protein